MISLVTCGVRSCPAVLAHLVGQRGMTARHGGHRIAIGPLERLRYLSGDLRDQ